jgi:DNA primase
VSPRSAECPLPEPVDDQQFQKTKKRREEKKKLSDQSHRAQSDSSRILGSGACKAKVRKRKPQSRISKAAVSRRISRNSFESDSRPTRGTRFLNHLKEKGADEKLIEQSGLVSVNEEKDRVFDRFRGRIMFPVLDVNGNPVAFGARAMGDDHPKYLNSPETPAYVKGEHLYGLFQSKDEIRKKKFAILVEGYLDLIALVQHDIKNVAASLGTAFTPDQSKLLGRFTKKIVINYDGDVAGIGAARRAVEILLPNDFEIKVLVLPDGKDPDDFVREHGTKAYNEARGRAIPFLEFVLDSSMQGRALANAKQKAEAIEEVLPVLSDIKNPIQKRESFDQAMNFFRVESSGLKRDLWSAVKQGSKLGSDTLRKAGQTSDGSEDHGRRTAASRASGL